MWIDIAIIFVAFILFSLGYFLMKWLKREVTWLYGFDDSEKAIKWYNFAYHLLHIFMIIFFGVITYVYVFQ